MKRSVGCSLVGLIGVLLAGCPIYPNDNYCYDDLDCPSSSYCAYDGYCTPRPTGTGGGAHAETRPCSRPEHCGQNETCGTDGLCHSGSCLYSGCVAGYACVVRDSEYACVPSSVIPDAGVPDTSTPDSGPDAASGEFCANPSDCGPGKVCSSKGHCEYGSCDKFGCVGGYVCSSNDAVVSSCVLGPSSSWSCVFDKDCPASGGQAQVCVSGRCKTASALCSDKSQCADPSKQNCVNGVCLSSCKTTAQCPAGYDCDVTLGVCSKPSKSCAVTADCGSANLVCVGSACVNRCESRPDGGTTCPAGLRCVGNGCVPDGSAANAVCAKDGQQDACNAGSICLHHACYLACTKTPTDSCAPQPIGLNVCGDVATATGKYQICGASTAFGSECDVSASVACTAPKVCIDGTCR